MYRFTQIIQNIYLDQFGRHLMDDINSYTNGHFKCLLVALLTPIADFYALELHDAMANPQRYVKVMIEVLCSSSNRRIDAIKEAYARSKFDCRTVGI